jgi:hypothetical protein
MVVVALRGPRIRAPPNVIATLIRRHFNGLRGPPLVGTPNATHEGILSGAHLAATHILFLSEKETNIVRVMDGSVLIPRLLGTVGMVALV